jgi:hypothetical protein
MHACTYLSLMALRVYSSMDRESCRWVGWVVKERIMLINNVTEYTYVTQLCYCMHIELVNIPAASPHAAQLH